MRRRGPALLALAVLAFSAGAGAADLDAPMRAELRRGMAAAAHWASDAPALRLERQTREPSAAFSLGAALAAWINAAAQLDYDLKTPSGDGDDSEAIHLDCVDEALALDHLEAGRKALGVTPAEVLGAAAAFGPDILDAWRVRQSAVPKGCR